MVTILFPSITSSPGSMRVLSDTVVTLLAPACACPSEVHGLLGDSVEESSVTVKRRSHINQMNLYMSCHIRSLFIKSPRWACRFARSLNLIEFQILFPMAVRGLIK